MSIRNRAFIIITVTSIYGIVLLMTAFSLSLPIVFGQQQSTSSTTIGADNIPDNIKLQEQEAYLQVLPPSGVQSNAVQINNEGTIGTIMGMVSTGLALYSNYRNGKTQSSVQKVASNQVRIVETQEGINNQVFDIMPQKGNEITNKPEIKQSTVAAIKKEALDNASKA